MKREIDSRERRAETKAAASSTLAHLLQLFAFPANAAKTKIWTKNQMKFRKGAKVPKTERKTNTRSQTFKGLRQQDRAGSGREGGNASAGNTSNACTCTHDMSAKKRATFVLGAKLGL